MGERARARCSTSCSTCCATTASTTSTSSCRPSRAEKAVGTDEEWDEATEALRAVARGARTSSYVLDEGGGAFYGPKISVQVTRRHRPHAGRCRRSRSTSSMPQRFDLEYVGADNERHQPVMIHRALFGSVERFFGVLLEHYAGAFPAWLAPVQVRVLPRARRPPRLRRRGRRPAAGRRASGPTSSTPTSTLGDRIRKAKVREAPYVLVVGDDDVEHGTVGRERPRAARSSAASRVDDVRRAPRRRGRWPHV